jgi:lipopolysaccharide export system permease protein
MTMFDRYVFFEMLQWLSIGTLVILGLFFGTAEFSNALSVMQETGMPLHTVLSVMALQLPTGLGYCLPGGVVIATMLVLMRQSDDCEIIALQLLGTPMRRILLPFLCTGLAGALACFALCEKFAPQSRDLSRKLFASELRHTVRPFPSKNEVRLLNKSGGVDRIIALGPAQGATVQGFASYDLTHLPVIKLISAQSATWQDNNWTLLNGHLFDLFSSDVHQTQSRFDAMHLRDVIKVSDLVDRGFKTTLDKTTAELAGDIAFLKSVNKAVPNYLYFQYFRRYTHPLSCFLLVFAAAPLALLRRRKPSNFSLIYGGSLILTFFLLQQVCLSLTTNGRLDPLMASVLPSLLLLLIGFCTTAVLRRA